MVSSLGSVFARSEGEWDTNGSEVKVRGVFPVLTSRGRQADSAFERSAAVTLRVVFVCLTLVKQEY